MNHIDEYQAIQEQIRVLQERAAQLVQEKRAEAIASIKAMIGIYNLTAADVGLVAKAPPRPPRKRDSRTNAPRPAKYRDPVSGDTWTGQGREPKWIEGQDREPFLMDKPPAPPVVEQTPPAAAPTQWPEHLRVAGAHPIRGQE
jgi:DNA-binding protein H-NS